VKLLALGVDHRSAPTAIREALAFEGARRDQGLDALRAVFPGNEFVVLSTCNRVEIYSASEGPATAPEVAELATWLAGFHTIEPARLAGHLVTHHDEAVIGHLFRVAASLESLVLGEGQIMGQTREAYKAAEARGSVGPILHPVFQNALRVGKKVREETGMDRGKLSIASVAVDVARDVFDTFSDKAVLVIGAGKMGDLTLQHLAELQPGQILITNRSPERAQAAAVRWRARAIPFERLDDALIEADVVVSTTAADEPIVSAERYAVIQKRRRNRLALILDIAVPRDFDPRVGEISDQVMLYNVDDLRAQVEQHLAGRRKGIEPAQAIIERETAVCWADLRHQRHAGALLRQLGDYADSVRLREQDALYARLPHLSDADREAIAHSLRRVQNQFLHHPRTALRAAAASSPASESAGPSHPLLQMVRHLFGLGDEGSTKAAKEHGQKRG
jgi:glutamyl-tRNA reductase